MKVRPNGVKDAAFKILSLAIFEMLQFIRSDDAPGQGQLESPPAESPQRSNICAVIVTYNIGESLHRCVNAIENQVARVLIVDNGSGEATRRELDKLAASESISLILNERNEGLAHAYNQAVQWARNKGFHWILTLDHDSEATPGMVDVLVRGYEALDQTGIRNVAIVAANPFDLNSGKHLYDPPRENGGLPLWSEDAISSGSLICLRAFDIVGMFNEDLFIYFVDFDFCKRLMGAGFGIYICPEAVFLHKEGVKKRHKFLWIDRYYDHYGKAARYYITRNTIYLFRHFHLSREDIRYLIERLWVDHVNVVLFDDERFSVLWFSLKGLIDGLRGKFGPLDSRGSVRGKARRPK